MEAIWMIIFIAALIFQAISKISGSKGKLPRQWEPVKLPGQGQTKEPKKWDDGMFPPVLKDWEFPWDDSQWDEVSSKEQSSQNKKPEPKKRKEVTASSKTLTDRGLNRENVNQRDNTEYRPELSLNSGDVLNGLIISELLQPPKCKRKR